MAQTVPVREPSTVVAGDSVTWRKTLADYPADQGWALSYVLINAAGKITINAAADGDSHLVSVLPATSALWAPGEYTWQGSASKAGERYTVETGTLTIKPDLAAQAAGFDTRSSARQALDLFEQAIVTQGATAWTLEYEIAGRRMKFRSVDEFLKMLNKLRSDVARETAADRIAAGLGGKSKIYVRF